MAFDTFDPDIVVTTGSAGTFVTLSNGNLTALGSTSNYTTVQTVEGKTAGKWYVEFTRNQGGSVADGVGIYNSWGHSAASGNNYVGAANSNLPSSDQGWEYFCNGAGLFNHGSSQTIVNMPSYGAGDVIGLAIDLDNKRLWFRKNTGSWGGTSGTPNPATNTGGFDITNMLSNNCRVYPMCDMGNQSPATKWTANFGASAFTGSVPSGFTSGWTNTTAGTYFGTFAISRGNSTLLSSINITGDKIVGLYTSTLSGSVSNVVITFGGNAGTVSNLKGVIYDATGTGGLPGALLGVSTNTITSGNYGEQTFTFSGVTVVNGTNYWVGFVSSATNSTTLNQLIAAGVPSSILVAYNSGTYASPTNPFGASPTTSSFRIPAIINVATAVAQAIIGRVTAQAKVKAPAGLAAVLKGRATEQAKLKSFFGAITVLKGRNTIATKGKLSFSGTLTLKARATVASKLKLKFGAGAILVSRMTAMVKNRGISNVRFTIFGRITAQVKGLAKKLLLEAECDTVVLGVLRQDIPVTGVMSNGDVLAIAGMSNADVTTQAVLCCTC